jgi:hypothetical protein
MAFSSRENAARCYLRDRSSLEQQLQSELYLPRGVCVGGPKKAGWHAVLSREDIDSNGLIGLYELGRVALKTILRDRGTLSRFSRLKDSAVSSSFTRSPA